MNLKKLSVTIVVITMVSIGFGNIISDNAQGAFINNLSGTGLIGGFSSYDVAWNDDGTMAVVAGHEIGNGQNAYAYFPDNDTYFPLTNFYGLQSLNGVEYSNERVIPTPSVLLVDADYNEEGQIVGAYQSALASCNADVTVWDSYPSPPAAKPRFADMVDYDVVIWVPTRMNMDGNIGPGDAFNTADENEIAQYLAAGGNFMLSNIYYTDYTDAGSYAYTPGDFAYDYFGINHITDPWSMYDEYINETVNDAVYDGIGTQWLDWWINGWGGSPDENEYLFPSNGEICFFGTDSGMVSYYPMGIRYDQGDFKSTFFGFPFEAISSNSAREDIMENTLEWFMPGSQGPTRQSSVLIVDADYHEDGLADAYDWALTNNSWDVTIWDVYPSNTKPVSGNLMGYDLVVWVPSRDMQGAAGNGDAFNSVDENQVTGYLGLGGNFFLSNIYWSDWSSGGGFYNPGDFAYDVFGINDMNNQWSSYEDYVQGWGGDEVFDGFGPAWYDWNKYDWGGSKPNACDEINPMFATNGVEIVEDMMSSYNGGVYYDEGNFKSMFMGFPFEVMTQPYTDDFWARALEWFEPGSTAWDPASFEYQDVWWVCGDYPGSFPPTAYRVVPSEGLTLQSLGTSNVFQDVSCDHLGNPLFVSRGGNDMQYYDYLSESWYSITSGATVISDYDFFSVDFNENDRRFYFAGERNTDSMVTMWYTDAAPLDSGTAQAYAFNYLPIVDKILYSIAWNQVYDYGLAVGEDMVYKVQPYDYYGNGTLGYSVINTTFGTARDVSWDTDGYNEAGIVGSQGVNFEGTYWRFYDSNPQLIEEYGTGVIFTPFMTCAMKPPSSPKWLFIPSSTGDIRVNIEEKDESGELTINADQPHIITMNMWKQSDGTKASVLNKPLDADTTYTFFIEANYTIGGVDQWSDPTFQIDLMAWYDGGINLGAASVPGDPSWTSDEFRTRQFNVSFQTNTNTASLNYPVPGAGGPEFALDYWVDPASYGVDGSYNQIYLNITFGKLTAVAGSDLLMGPSATPWDVNSLLNADSWDFRAMAYIPSSTIKNVSYGEFGINEYASVSVIGSPGGSVPPGVTDYALSTPSRIYYSTNAPYTLNVSVPNIYKDGNPASPNWIDASDVKVQNTHVDADITNSEIHTFPTPFVGPGDDLHIWWIAGAPVNPTNHGTEMAGPTHSDFSAAGAFEVTEVYWWITVPAGLPEGVYRGTITITLWH